MLDFRLDEEQQMLVDAINRFSEERVRKQFRDAEEEGAIPAELVQQGWEIGVLPTAIPEAFGGFGEHNLVTGAIATEEFAYGDFAITLNIMTPNLFAVPVMISGTDAQKSSYLPLFVEGELPSVTAALTEPVYQFDPRNLDTTATLDGDSYVISGKKIFVPLGNSAETMLVYANENGTTQAFIIPTATAGVTVGERDKLMGIKALPTYAVSFDNVRVGTDARLGGEAGCDFSKILNHSRIALGAAAVGIARAGVEYAKEYAKQRVQFGKPVAQNQSIAFMLADMASDVESARLLVWEAAWKLDRGEDVTRDVTVMKHYVDQAVMRVADSALQTLGGYGYIREYPVELWLRNARSFTSFDGMAII
ncbi:MAG: acyl-CoA dehydrogenase family protein [Candidatus Promineifilaceae bacterium]